MLIFKAPGTRKLDCAVGTWLKRMSNMPVVEVESSNSKRVAASESLPYASWRRIAATVRDAVVAMDADATAPR